MGKMTLKDSALEFFVNNYAGFYKKYLPKIEKIGGDEYRAACPFHDDSKPSLNFNNRTGQFLCHGCGEKGDAFHFYAKINSLDTQREFPKILKGIASDFNIPFEDVQRRLIETYDYTSPDGMPIFQVCRFEPKAFRQRHKANGKWVWNLKGISRVLYRLPEVLKAQEVLIVEGEKDADMLTELGFTVTTCPMGAKKWRPEYNEYLKDKDIVLIPDNDNEGREHMALVGVSLNGTSASLKLLKLPGLPSKGDVSDWIAGFADKDEAGERLAVMIDGAKPYAPPKKATIEDVVLESIDFRALDLPEKKILLAPWLTEQGIALISGWRGPVKHGRPWVSLTRLRPDSLLALGNLGNPFPACF